MVRNRIRRRLRAALTAEATEGLAPGWYLITAGPAAATADYRSLCTSVHAVMGQIRAEAAP